MSKLGRWWNPFVQTRKCICLKFTEDLCVMTMENDTEIEKELTYRLKIDIRNLKHFDPTT